MRFLGEAAGPRRPDGQPGEPLQQPPQRPTRIAGPALGQPVPESVGDRRMSGGAFFDIWTPSTLAQSGLLVSNTQTSGRVYEMSAEHHVRHEVQLHGVANWELHALQQEAERAESGFDLPLEILDSSCILITNLHVYRVISSDQPFRLGRDALPTCGTSASAASTRTATARWPSTRRCPTAARARAAPAGAAWLDVSGAAPPPAAGPPSRAPEPGAAVERLAGGFHNISGGAVLPPATSTSSTRAGSGSIAGPRRTGGSRP